MALYRTVQMSFWTDTKMVDDFTPEDKYFYLYLFTNPHTNLCGCYQVSLAQMSVELGYTKDIVLRLLERFSNVHNAIRYSKENKEILLLNWHKYNWTTSEKYEIALRKQMETIKTPAFFEYVNNLLENGEAEYPNDTLSIPYTYPMDTTITNTNTITNNSNTNTDTIKGIIEYLNIKADKNFNYKTKNTVLLINGRLKDGYVLEDFKKVIDVKVADWKNDKKMNKFLRPDTLFAQKNFESYLNQKEVFENAKYNAIKNFAGGDIL